MASIDQYLNEIVEEAPLGIFITNDEGKYTYANETGLELLGYTLEELQSLTLFELVHPEDKENEPIKIKELKTGNIVTTERRLLCKSGSYIAVEISGKMLEDGSFIGFGKDITERIEAESIIKTQTKQLQDILANVDAIILEGDPYKFDILHGRVEEILGYPKEDWFNHTAGAGGFWNDLLHPEDKNVAKICESEIKECRDHDFEYRLLHKNGEYRWFYDTVTVEGINGVPLKARSIAVDITKQKAADKKIRDTLTRYETLFNSAPVGIAISRAGDWMFVNPTWLQMHGYDSLDEIIGQNVNVTISPKEYKRVAKVIQDRATGLDVPTSYEITAIKKNGSEFLGKIEVASINLPDGPATLGFIRDISQQREAERELQKTRNQLFQAQKMEAIGQIAGGVAHDFNNLLTLITLNSEVLISKIPRTDPAFANLQNIIESVKTATVLTSELLLFSRNRVMKPKIIDVNSVIKKYLSTFGQFIKSNIKQLVKLDPMVGDIEIDPTRLDQALMNLTINAVDAMPDGGTLTVETKYIAKNTIKHQGEFNIRPFVEISVTDTGIGMDEDTQKRIFDPFFTTKEEGKGTGLGLATTYSIIQQSDGFIKVNSEVNQGSKMMIYIPLIVFEEDLVIEKAKISSKKIQDDQFILLIDDDESIREIIKNILEMSGFDVLDAGNAFEALRIYKENIEMITLIITDIIMPNVTGLELIDQIREINSSVKVLFMTGYTKNFQPIADQTDSNTGFLQKPFDRDALINKLNELIDE